MNEKYSWAKECSCGENKRRADYSLNPTTKAHEPVWVCINCNKETPRRLPKSWTNKEPAK